MSERVLVVVAHPDDEVLCCGATLNRYARDEVKCSVAFMVGAAEARDGLPADGRLRQDAINAVESLGASIAAFGTFPNIRMNGVDHLDLVQFVESLVRSIEPSTIITHHPSDLNIDHRETANAVLAASRLSQRTASVRPLRRLLLAETLSATDWSFPQLGATSFDPTFFVEVDEEDVLAKLAALECYEGVMRPPPHSRSVETVRALATVRGSAAGCRHAEAFEVAFEVSRDASRSQ